jgi:hypothetical protein
MVLGHVCHSMQPWAPCMPQAQQRGADALRLNRDSVFGRFLEILPPDQSTKF